MTPDEQFVQVCKIKLEQRRDRPKRSKFLSAEEAIQILTTAHP